MSRVSYAMLHADGAREMTRAVRAALAKLVAGARGEGRRGAARDPRGRRWSATRSCTTCCSASTRCRWAARRSRSRRTAPSGRRAAELGIRAHPGARVYVLPCIAGHVGADTAGMILAEEPHAKAEGVHLLVDVGHERRDRPGQRERLLAASSPTGPAFEGAQISGGQRAAPGAIERVRIDRDDAGAALPGDRRGAWSDEPGFAAPPSRRPASPASAAAASSRSSRSCSSRASSPPTARSTARWPRARRAIVPDGRTFSYVLHEAPPGAPARIVHHPERRPRDPAREGRALRRRAPADGPARRGRTSTRSASPVRSAARSTCSTRWCSG